MTVFRAGGFNGLPDFGIMTDGGDGLLLSQYVAADPADLAFRRPVLGAGGLCSGNDLIFMCHDLGFGGVSG